jgi:hypothetical protein
VVAIPDDMFDPTADTDTVDPQYYPKQEPNDREVVDLVIDTPTNGRNELFAWIQSAQSLQTDTMSSDIRVGKVFGMLLLLSEYIAHSRPVKQFEGPESLIRRPAFEPSKELKEACMMYDQYLSELTSFLIGRLGLAVNIAIRNGGNKKDFIHPPPPKRKALKSQ